MKLPLHKTLSSYHENKPWEEEGEHPDGPLWLCTREEYLELPTNFLVESVHGTYYNKHDEVFNDPTEFELEYGRMMWGIRGHRTD